MVRFTRLPDQVEVNVDGVHLGYISKDGFRTSEFAPPAGLRIEPADLYDISVVARIVQAQGYEYYRRLYEVAA